MYQSWRLSLRFNFQNYVRFFQEDMVYTHNKINVKWEKIITRKRQATILWLFSEICAV